MVFSSFTFLVFFLPFTVIVYFLLKYKHRNAFLLLMSLVFYMWGSPQYTLVMLGVIVINYFCGIFIDRYDSQNRLTAKKRALAIGIILNLSVLIVFKYGNFIMGNVNNQLALLGMDPLSLQKILLPIGVSFYIFQSISYLVDVYRNDARVQRKPGSLALYIALFPQLVAGPIVRYNTVEKQIEKRTVTLDAFNTGLKIFVIGLGKKILIANSMAGIADTIFLLDPHYLAPSALWIGIVAYTLQLYFDFSGYSDMAIGLGMMFGFTFPVNFNYPYLSKSVTEFWRRWHLSLSAWFKDYLYIPLGGSRVSVPRTYVNLFIVFLATGIWHGANWTFFVWGVYEAVLIVLEKYTGYANAKRFPFLRWIIATVITLLGLVIFRSETLSQAGAYLAVMLGVTKPEAVLVETAFFVNWYYVLVMAIGAFGATPLFKNSFLKGLFVVRQDEKARELVVNVPSREEESKGALRFAQNVFLLAVLFLCLLQLANSSYNPFIYFRF